MFVGVAIVGYRNIDDVVSCLTALSSSTYSDFQVIVCENGGNAAYAELLAAAPPLLPNGQKVRIFDSGRNLGFAGGVNVCMRECASADAWWILNPDTIPNSDALEKMVERLARGDCEAVGSTVHLHAGYVQSYGGHWSRYLARGVSIGRGLPTSAAVDPHSIEKVQNYLNGASMLMSRRFLEATGFMREDYFLYCEEVEWCLRGLSNGMRLGYANDSIVIHHQGTTTGTGEVFARRAKMPVYLNERNRLLLTRDCFPILLPIAIPAALLQLALRAVRDGAWFQFGYGFSGWLAGLLNERGMPAWMK